MKLTQSQYNKIKSLLPTQRGNVQVDNHTFLNALVYISENRCTWRTLPKQFGKWATIYKRYRRWSENGVLKIVITELRKNGVEIDFSALPAIVESMKVRPKKKAQTRLSAAAGNTKAKPRLSVQIRARVKK